MQIAEQYEHAGVPVRIYYDEDAASPREEDNLGEMHVSYRGYNLGDHQLPAGGLPDIECPPCGGHGEVTEETCQRCCGLGQVEPTLAEWLRSLDATAAIPLFVYEHGGITIRGGRLVILDEDSVGSSDTRATNRFSVDAEGWDTSFVGFMVVTEEAILELCGEGSEFREADWLDSALRSELKEYDRYLRGEVYGYVVAEDTPFEDSCWGFIGLGYAREEADHSAELAAARQNHEELARAEWAARDVLTVTAAA